MKKPEILFFDMGDTVFTSRNGEPFHYEDGFQAVLRHTSGAAGGVTAATLAAEYKAFEQSKRIDTGSGVEDRTMEVPFSTALRYLLDLFGLTLHIPYLEAAELFWRNRTTYVPCDGVGELFRFLRGRGIRTAMITNNLFEDTIIRRRLDEVIPDNQLEFIVSSADYACCKPSPQLFRIALRKAGVTADAAWHAGDSIDCDVLAANAVGIHPVWYRQYSRRVDGPSGDVGYLRADTWQDVMDALG